VKNATWFDIRRHQKQKATSGSLRICIRTLVAFNVMPSCQQRNGKRIISGLTVNLFHFSPIFDVQSPLQAAFLLPKTSDISRQSV